MQIFSANGALVELKETGKLDAGENKVGISLDKFPSGVYFLSYTISGREVKHKVVLMK